MAAAPGGMDSLDAQLLAAVKSGDEAAAVAALDGGTSVDAAGPVRSRHALLGAARCGTAAPWC